MLEPKPFGPGEMFEHAGDCPSARHDADVVVLLRKAVDNGERATALSVEVVDERRPFVQDTQAIPHKPLTSLRNGQSGGHTPVGLPISHS